MSKKGYYKSVISRILAVIIFFTASFFACKEKEMDVLRNGYSYEILDAKGGTTPRPEQIVTLELELIDEFGNILDDSRTSDIRPAIKVPGQRVAGTESNPLLALIELMGPGDSARVIVPIDSLPNPPQEFRQSAFIDYHLKVVSIEDEGPYNERMVKEQKIKESENAVQSNKQLDIAQEAIEKYKAGTLKGKKIELGGGLIVHIIFEGKGEKGELGERVDVHYYGFLEDGTSFDNSFRTGRPYPLTVGGGGSIQGWLQGIPELPEGSKAVLDIPSALGYGAAGNSNLIPPNADLFFYVEIDKVFKSK